MRKTVAAGAVHVLCAAGLLALAPAAADPQLMDAQGFPVLPLPPVIDGLIGFPQTYTKGRSAYLALITNEAEQRGFPAALADAVAKIESGFNPNVVGGVGEVGLMQVRPQTAAMLGYKGNPAGLFEPETNVRFGVTYLAHAWELANGDVCRTLMKYRAGWGEERMTPLSVEYCRRARGHLAAIGSPLAGDALPASAEPAVPFAASRPAKKPQTTLSPGPSGTLPANASQGAPLPNLPARAEPVRIREVSRETARPTGAEPKATSPSREALRSKREVQPAGAPSTAVTRTAPPPLPPGRPKVASVGAVTLSAAQMQTLQRAREQERQRADRRRRIWAEHDSRMADITAKLKAPQLKIMSGF